MQETESSRSGRRSPWLERGILLAVIAGLGLWVAYDQFVGAPHTIVVDGKPAVTLESRQDANSVLDEVRNHQLAGKKVESSAFAQRVSIRRAPEQAEIDTAGNAVSTLDEMLVLKAQAYAIIVDDKPVIALPNEQGAYRTLDLVKQKYAQRVKNLYSRPSFRENTVVDRRYLPVETILATPEDGVDYLTTVHEKPTYHTLKPGDRAVHLTVQYGISLDELKKMNPGINIDRLTEGDKLLMRRPKPPVTVITKALITKITPVKAPAERGMPAKTGKRQVWAVVTYENGNQVGQDAIRVMTTWDKPAPKPAYTGKKGYGTYRRTQR